MLSLDDHICDLVIITIAIIIVITSGNDNNDGNGGNLPPPSSITNFSNPTGFLTIALLLFAIAELNLVFKAHFTKIQNRKYKKYKHNVHTVFLHEN